MTKRRMLEALASGERPPPRLAASAQAELDRREEARQNRLERSRRRRLANKAHQELVEHQHQDMVDRCRTRAAGICELGGHHHPQALLDPHHLLAGRGRRLEEETEENTMMACRRHHDDYHVNAFPYRTTVLRWCLRHGYPVPNRKEFREP